MKQAKVLLVRVPSWTDRGQVSCAVNGKQRKYTWEGFYVRMGEMRPGDEVVVTFPMVEKTLERKFKSEKYTITLRGFTVMELLPKADVTPLFQRASYRGAEAPVKNVTRFVSDQQRIIW